MIDIFYGEVTTSKLPCVRNIVHELANRALRSEWPELTDEECEDILDKFNSHYSNCCKSVDKQFLYTVNSWYRFWMQLDENGVPYWKNRGTPRDGMDNYVMGRYYDYGAYHPYNCYPVTGKQNLSDKRSIVKREEYITTAEDYREATLNEIDDILSQLCDADGEFVEAIKSILLQKRENVATLQLYTENIDSTASILGI